MILASPLMVASVSLAFKAQQEYAPLLRSLPNTPNPVATFNTSMGIFKAEIFLDRVPITASNFIDLSRSGFYNGMHKYEAG